MCMLVLMRTTSCGAMGHRKRSFSSACSKDELQICVNLETPKEVEHGYQRAVDDDTTYARTIFISLGMKILNEFKL